MVMTIAFTQIQGNLFAFCFALFFFFLLLFIIIIIMLHTYLTHITNIYFLEK